MDANFNADEIFEMAEEIERQGARFYRKVAERLKDAAQKDLLLNLAAMEDNHEKTFSSMRKDFSDQEFDPNVFDPEGLAASYLRAIAKGKVFNVNNSSKILTGQETIGDILNMAIGFEKDSIVFYIGIKEMVPDTFGKDKVDKIIEEEMRHIVMLTEEL
ncbi:MAG: ferritin family protein [Thermodesulfobacteriota bacterium]|nr:ferritin family protein [Thermodesulfobacteriota bacterium]